MEAIGRFVVGLMMVVFSILIGGWVFSVLWGWFMVPIFGLSALGLAGAIGIKTIVALVVYHQTSSMDEAGSTLEQLGKSLAHVFGINITALVCGWIVHYFI